MIACDRHDYVEIACTFRLPVRLVMEDGAVIDGVALDTGYDDQRQECLMLDVAGERRAVVLDRIITMTALKTNPHFDTVHLAP